MLVLSQVQIMLRRTKKKRPHCGLLFLVAQVALHWNLICEEIVRWSELLGDKSLLVSTPARY